MVEAGRSGLSAFFIERNTDDKSPPRHLGPKQLENLICWKESELAQKFRCFGVGIISEYFQAAKAVEEIK